ncbi:DUF2007 domain-containing protein [bacterium]|nr:DUF2007 domain-containing protein [Verrucomicrobiales bacterium]MDC3254789.1 DUF2007 domain-containing protein [bacterium]
MLESGGIKTFVRNQDLVIMTTEVPIPDMFPVLCVMDEEDYPRALTILSELESSEEKAAPEETTKGIFVVGFAAGKSV